tara:strand:- start:589 stop:1635 length:1047 start_codon:yes stop_codon:yes gene_type:complete
MIHIAKKLTIILFTIGMSFISFYANAQKDTLKLFNGDILVGEIKTLNQGVLTMETDYSDSDFKIEWTKISEIYTNQLYTINLTDKTVLTHATIKTVGPRKLHLSDEYLERDVWVDEVVYFRQLDESFWSKLSASVDLGYSRTKAENLQQYNASAALGFKTDQWTVNTTYRQVRSTQDNVSPIRRVEGSASSDYMLRNGVFFGASLNFLSNTEQNLNLRTTGVVGSGYYIVRKNTWYWNSFIGVAINNEDYQEIETATESADRQSYEGAVATELNLYDLGDLNLYTNIYWYPSFTESGRHRIDYRFDISYDLPLDFYIKASITLNYDNQPIEGASESDYVIVTGFGWEL